MKEDKKTIETLKKTIKGMEKESRAYTTYKKLILACAESKNELIDIIDGLKFAAKNIEAKKWNIIERMLGSSGNLKARGICLKCKINLFGKNIKPLESSLPCGIGGCPFEGKEKQK